MPEQPPTVTVAVCTHNRPRLLRETLCGLVRQEYPTERYEIVVVDNGPADNASRAVVGQFSGAPVPVWYVREPEAGLSQARNRAVARSRSELVVFVDDDVIVEPGWLGLLVAPFSGPAGRRIGAIGGEVIPVFPEGVSRWALLVYQPLRLRLTAGPTRRMPMGANLAFRRTALLEAGLFDPHVGRTGNVLLAGDENRPIQRLRELGAEVWFVPEARVFHQMPRERTTLGYAVRHGFGSARSRVINQVSELRRTGRPSAGYLASRLAGNVPKALFSGAGAVLLTLLFQPASACPAWVRAARASGYVCQILATAAASARAALALRLRPVVEADAAEPLPLTEVSPAEPD